MSSHQLSSIWFVRMQVLVGCAGPEEDAATRRGTEGAGYLDRVSSWGSSQLHQPGLSQLRTHEPELERPRTIQLRGRTGIGRQKTREERESSGWISCIWGQKCLSQSFLMCHNNNYIWLIKFFSILLCTQHKPWGSYSVWFRVSLLIYLSPGDQCQKHSHTVAFLHLSFFHTVHQYLLMGFILWSDF